MKSKWNMPESVYVLPTYDIQGKQMQTPKLLKDVRMRVPKSEQDAGKRSEDGMRNKKAKAGNGHTTIAACIAPK